MKKLFALIVLVLAAASVYTWLSQPAMQEEVPIMYWKSDSNPQRFEQIELFHDWLIKKGHFITSTQVIKEKDIKNAEDVRDSDALYQLVKKDGKIELINNRNNNASFTSDGDSNITLTLKKPAAELRLDQSNTQTSMIHAVSGVGGDIIDVYEVTRFFHSMGVAEDLTPDAAAGKYDMAHTYPGLSGLFIFNGRQYAYLCNGNVFNMWFNLDTLKKYGMDTPPEEWTPETFEAYAREYVKRANADNPKPRNFFGESITGKDPFLLCMSRSMGHDFYNETMTRSNINNPATKKALELFYKWTYEDRLFPTAADVASANEAGGYGGATFSQFINGKLAMVITGRFALIRFRELKYPINVWSTQYPMWDFKNMIVSARSTIVYKGSKNKKYTQLFMEFLADKEYNEYIIEGADGLPPNPSYAIGNPKYLNPRPSEGNVHSAELKWALETSYSPSISPYFNILGTNWANYVMGKYFSNKATVDAALAEAEMRYNTGIDDTIKANDDLRKQYEVDMANQKIIDECKAQGKKIPAKLIKNPFYLGYYRAQGMLEE